MKLSFKTKFLSHITLACCALVGLGMIPPMPAQAVTSLEQRITDEATKFGLTIASFDTATVLSKCGPDVQACWQPGQIWIHLDGTTEAYLLDTVRHEAGHQKIFETCETLEPSIANGQKYYSRWKKYVGNFEYVTDMYANLYLGMSLGDGAYVNDPLVTPSDKATFTNIAKTIHTGQCGMATITSATPTRTNGATTDHYGYTVLTDSSANSLVFQFDGNPTQYYVNGSGYSMNGSEYLSFMNGPGSLTGIWGSQFAYSVSGDRKTWKFINGTLSQGMHLVTVRAYDSYG